MAYSRSARRASTLKRVRFRLSSALVSVLRSGLVTPQNGVEIFAALAAEKGCGLLDRLIADDYERRGLTALTLDARKARLPNARRL